ncbi:MAG: hypothetical protein ACRDQ5_15575 [Sciscionella sp.]
MCLRSCSSLWRGGLLPALAAGTLLVPGSRTWPQVVLTPTADPVSELAKHVATLARIAPQEVRAEMVGDPEGFATSIRGALKSWAGGGDIGGARLVLVVDQFEETFLRCTEEQHRQTFIRALCSAAGAISGGGAPSGEPPALVIVGVRGDFYDRCAAYPQLLPALQDGQIVLGPMRTSELRDAIERPARAAGLTLEPGLVETLLAELGTDNGTDHPASRSTDPGALPLLSHALHVTWENRTGNVLTVDGYYATGGILGAIATTAETLFQALDSAGRHAARRLLLRLIQIGDGVADTRLCAERKTLIAASPDPQAAAAVLDTFARARLITADEDTAEITHDALLRAWPRLRSWIDADRAGLYLHQQLTDAAQKWNRDGRPTAALYGGTILAITRDWSQDRDHRDDLGKLERDFLAASMALQTQQKQTTQRRRRYLLTSLIVMLVLSSLTGAGLFFTQNHSTPPDHPPQTILASQNGRIGAVAFSPDGHTLATGSNNGTIELWKVTEATHPTLLGRIMLNNSNVGDLAFSPDGHTLAIPSGGTTFLRQVKDRVPATPLGTLRTGDNSTVRSVVFSPDGRTLATGSSDGFLRLWDVAKPDSPISRELVERNDTVKFLTFSPNGQTLAIGTNDGSTQLWYIGDPEQQPTSLGALRTGDNGTVRSVALSPDGLVLATGSRDGFLRLWTTAKPKHSKLYEQRVGRPGTVTPLAFSPDGRMLAIGGGNGTTRLWNVVEPAHPKTLDQTLTGHTGAVNSVAFSPDGRMLAIGGSNGTLLRNVPSSR